MAEPALAPRLDPAPGAEPALRLVEGLARDGLKLNEPRLEIPPYDLAAALALERGLGISHVLAQILVRRDLSDPARAREFLDPRDEHSPGAFDGIDRALELIDRHVRARSRITVHGDYDV